MNRTVPKRPAPLSPRAGVPRSKKHLSRMQREQRLRRIFFAGAAVVLSLAILVPLVGYYREVVTKGAQPVAYVEGQPITLETFSKVYGFRLVNLDSNISQMQMLAAQSTGAGNMFSQQLQQLQARRGQLDQDVLEEVVDDRLMADEAARRGIAVTRDDEDARIAKDFGGGPQPTPTAAPNATPSEATPVPTIDPIERFRTAIGTLKFMTEDEYRALIVRPTIIRERLRDAVVGDVPSKESQVHARHILLEGEDAAKSAKERLTKGDAFDQVAKELSKDTSNKDQGGDLGWFGRGRMTKPFEDAAFELPVGRVSDPIQSAFGWHLIEVLEKDENRALEPSEIDSKKEEQFRTWLDKHKDELSGRQAITYEWSPDKATWARNQVNRARGLPLER